MSGLSIVFAGTPAFGLPSLQALHESPHSIKAVYTQPDRPAGRGQKLQASPIKSWAQELGIAVYQPLNFKADEDVEALRALQPDVMVVIAYGLILPERVLSIPRYGCINVHASLLPRWRGASPIVQAILAGDTKTGVTIMQMDKGMDTGDMLMPVACEIETNETSQTLHDKLSALSAKPLLETLMACLQGALNPQKQDDSLATYAPKIHKEQAAIDWHKSAHEIDCQIRAFNPWPVAYAVIGDDVCRIHEASVEFGKTKAKPGEIIAKTRQALSVACRDGIIHITRLQFPGGRAMSVSDWMNGSHHKISVGDSFHV